MYKNVSAQEKRSPADKVNVFLGTSGDHGQLSPAASYPFSMLSIGPETYPSTHTGYEYKAKKFLGFTHNRFEGVGCRGSGGNILIKPFTGNDPGTCDLVKSKESASPGSYSVSFQNHIRVSVAVIGRSGIENFHFPNGKKSFMIDLSYAHANRFIAEEHTVKENTLSGWIESGTTCRAGVYRLYYCLLIDGPVKWTDSTQHILIVQAAAKSNEAIIRIAFSSVSTEYAKAAIISSGYEEVKNESKKSWNDLLGHIRVKGNETESKLFYSLLYRTLQSPYNISEPDGNYRAVDGSLQHSPDTVYNGWAIWDNYRTQLPLLSVICPREYGSIIHSIAGLYRYGKKDWATAHEPSNTVRTEHAVVVLLDAYRKGYPVDFISILDSLVRESDSLDFSHPDKALESSYDRWALSEICRILEKDDLAAAYKEKSQAYKTYWRHDFQDLTKPDVDRLGARDMYQGTIWQYRWFVPFDVKGLIALCGGDSAYRSQLDRFFEKDYYNQANEPDIQAPYMYNMSAEPWKSQELIRRYAHDTVVQYYFDDNYRGIDPAIDRVFNNRPGAFVRSMDDDAGAMSAWYIFAACGLSPTCVGWPVYYLSVPLFREISFVRPGYKNFTIRVEGFSPRNKYIQSVLLNGTQIDRNWITQQEIMRGGTLLIVAGAQPNRQFGTRNQWITASK